MRSRFETSSTAPQHERQSDQPSETSTATLAIRQGPSRIGFMPTDHVHVSREYRRRRNDNRRRPFGSAVARNNRPAAWFRQRPPHALRFTQVRCRSFYWRNRRRLAAGISTAAESPERLQSKGGAFVEMRIGSSAPERIRTSNPRFRRSD